MTGATLIRESVEVGGARLVYPEAFSHALRGFHLR